MYMASASTLQKHQMNGSMSTRRSVTASQSKAMLTGRCKARIPLRSLEHCKRKDHSLSCDQVSRTNKILYLRHRTRCSMQSHKRTGQLCRETASRKPYEYNHSLLSGQKWLLERFTARCSRATACDGLSLPIKYCAHRGLQRIWHCPNQELHYLS